MRINTCLIREIELSNHDTYAMDGVSNRFKIKYLTLTSLNTNPDVGDDVTLNI